MDARELIDGNHTLRARVTTQGGVFREVSQTVRIDNPDIIDLVITSVSAPAATAARMMSITYTMRNDGNVPSGPATIRAEYAYQGG